MIERAHLEKYRVAVIVYGLVNFESYFKGREEVERRRASNSTLYPYLETTYRYFVSFRPAYRRNLVRLAAMANEELRGMVEEWELEPGGNVQLRYSDALARADLGHVELIHPVDGWHASVAGHNILAESAFDALAPSLEFLGIAGGAEGKDIVPTPC